MSPFPRTLNIFFDACSMIVASKSTRSQNEGQSLGGLHILEQKSESVILLCSYNQCKMYLFQVLLTQRFERQSTHGTELCYLASFFYRIVKI
jgi:hypothetical protein